MPRITNNTTLSYFETLNDTHHLKCKMTSCGNKVIWRYSAKEHLVKIHDMYEEEDERTWRNDTYLLWQYFSRRKNFWARCEFCGSLVFVYRRHHLEYHLDNCNKNGKNALAKIQEDVTCSWLSQYFTFTGRNAYCNICKFQNCNKRFRIFEGRDVLESHVKHHYESGMMQQFVYETNYAGPSFYHDNTHTQSLRNREAQQGPVASTSRSTDYVTNPLEEQIYQPFPLPVQSHGPAIGDTGASYESSVARSTDYNMNPPQEHQIHQPFPLPVQSYRPAIGDIGVSYESSVARSTDYNMNPPQERQIHQPFPLLVQSHGPAMGDIGVSYESSVARSTDYNMNLPQERQIHQPFPLPVQSHGPAMGDIGVSYEPVPNTSRSTDYNMNPPQERPIHQPFPLIEDTGAPSEWNYSGQRGPESYRFDDYDWPDDLYMN